MMKVELEYVSSWRNSFLQGSNNEPLPKKGRNYVGSMTELSKDGNFINREVTIDTVMGLLNRLIGDQRKLYQSRSDTSYFFKNTESLVQWEDTPFAENEEIVYIRNTKGSHDQNSFTGMIKTNSPAFSFDKASDLWGILFLDIDSLFQFLKSDNYIKPIKVIYDPISIIERLEFLNKEKAIDPDPIIMNTLKKEFSEIEYLDKKNKIKPISLYCSALYLKLNNLTPTVDLEGVISKAGNLTGISKKGFTKKDFMNAHTTGDKKIIWGNPFVKESMIKGEGRTKTFLTKASGKLTINLDIHLDKAKELRDMIDNAGVSSFYLGKKGLAHITKITI